MKKNIFVVDDEPVNLYIIENILTEYNVKCFDSGKKMWNFLQDNTADLILLDIMMPEEDGYEIAQKLSKEDKFKDIPIIFLTAKDGGMSVKKGFESGGDDYIIKPFDQIVLKARIDKVIEKKTNEIELRQKSITDPLTGLYNRRYFFERLENQIEHIKRNKSNFSISMIDIDHFKEINDMHGHLAGDMILRELSRILKKYMRPYDIVARYGGEEFIILSIDCDKKESCEILQRIKTIVEKTGFEYKSDKINFTFSGGISDINDVKDIKFISSEEIIKIADDRLLIAKQSGRNMIKTGN